MRESLLFVLLTLVLGPVAAQSGPEAAASGPTIRVRAAEGEASFRFESAEQLATIITGLGERGGGEILFAPGVYEFEKSVEVADVRGIELRGSPGTVFRLRAIPEFGTIRIKERTTRDQLRLVVDDPASLRPGSRYQVFAPDLEGNRLVEFVVAAIKGDVVTIRGDRNWQIKAFEPGQLVLPHLNFFEFHASEGITFRGIRFDGGVEVAATKLGDRKFSGHTTHSGLLFYNGYAADEAGRRPRPMRGLTIRDCRFGRLLGRGIAVYNMTEVRIEDCDFEDIGAEAVEMDHLSSVGLLRGLSIRRALTGVQLNDVTAVTLCDSRIADCGVAIHVKNLLAEDGLNRGLIIRGNGITGARRGIVLDQGANENLIEGNLIDGARGPGIALGGSRNLVDRNLISGVKRVGIEDRGEGNRIEGNLILPAARGAAGFKAVVRKPDAR